MYQYVAEVDNLIGTKEFTLNLCDFTTIIYF
jgi:hypothetical protein